MAKMQGLAHVGLFVNDLERSVTFYTDVLEFDVIWRCGLDEPDGTSTKIAFVKNGDLTIEIVGRAVAEERKDGWHDHIAIAVEDIEEVAGDLRKKGISFESAEPVFSDRVFPHGAKWLTFRGSDGEHLEITEVLK
ncbi:lactoylglutathione lyase [Clostridia bacterium]|nr:lactoylglutathione lyase [Clostridia bacterium]